MKADTVTKDFISDAHIFADVFNYYIYDGKQVILPEQLREQDSAKIALPYGTDGAMVPIQKFRDVQKLYAAMTDGKMEYLLYGVENQSEIHYAMPVRNGLYDMLDYTGQVEKASKSHREAMKQREEEKESKDKEILAEKRKPNSGEFLGGFWRDDKLIPSLTVTIYFGSDEWDGPLSLFDMLEVTNPRVLSLLNDYQIQLIAPAQMSDEEIMKFQTNLREVLLYIKYSRDKEKLNGILKSNEKRFREVERRAADVINVITNSKLEYKEEELSIDMCQAIQEMREESRQMEAREIAKRFYDMGMETEKIAEGVGYDIDTVRAWLGLSGD